jgi:anaerobic selenocysteine-containing dehydrogenase
VVEARAGSGRRASGAADFRRYTRRAGRPIGGEAVAEASLPKSYVRLTHPLVRDTKGGELRQATWDEALDRTVAGFRAAMLAPRPAGARVPIGIFSCSKATNEVNFVAQKFARVVLGSNNIDSCNRT